MKKHLKIIIPIYIFIQFILMLLAIIPNPKVDYIACYLSIIVAFLMLFVFINKKLTFLFTALGLFFTLIADYFLILNDSHYLLATSIFLIAQICYAIRIYFEFDTIKEKEIYIIIRVITTILAILIPLILFKDDTDLLVIVSATYYITLVLSSVFSFTLIKKSKYYLVFAIGLLLFVCCDAFVGIFNLESYFNIVEGTFIHNIIHNEFNYSWLFYVPSQSLIGISLIKKTD